MKGSARGSSLIETVLALLLVSITMLGAVHFIANSTQGTRHNQDKEFAIEKAISMFDELKALVENTSGTDITILDNFDNGTAYLRVLTTQAGVTDPVDPASDNVPEAGDFKYWRQISVQKFPSLQTNDIRLVNVRVYRRMPGPAGPYLLAEVSGVIRTLADKYPPSQVYDVYCLAVENVPGWWVYMANLIPFVENAISDLQARNPGLQFRTHWIRKLSYGRDPEYIPYINNTQVSTSDVDSVYFYPGLMPAGSAVNYYYVPTHFGGRIRVDAAVQNDYDATDNPFPYALADSFNHAVRYPEEVALFNRRAAAGTESADTPTWRMLLEGMYAEPWNYTNALLINLHGELLPFPPLRNYSDPAKDPESHPGIRVVAHPENLRYGNTEDIRLRVYSYLTDPGAAGAPSLLDLPITVFIKGITDPAGITVTAIEGGLDADADGTPDAYAGETFDTTNDGATDMYYDTETVTGGVVLKLYHSPLVSPCADGTCATGGLPAGKRLYAMEYIPTPLEETSGGPAFGRDLSVSGDKAKNTARWIITIPDAALDDNRMWTFETRLGDDLTTGVLFPAAHQPVNLSRTYTWRGDDTWVYGDPSTSSPPHLPWTERFQILGDPRHAPYADVKANWNSSLHPLGYNRNFDDFHNGSGNMASPADPSNNFWPGFSPGVHSDGSASNDGWNGGGNYLEFDVNRMYQTLREGLLRSHAVYTTMTGFSYYYIGMGNEIGYDSDNGFPASIPVSSKPFTGSSGTRNEMSITDAQTGGVKYIKENLATGYWWGINWLGELYPDADYATWSAGGNLPTGAGAQTYVRVLRDAITEKLPTGTTFLRSLRRTREPGCTAFFNLGTSSAATFRHEYRDGQTGTLQAAGTEIAANYHFALPDSTIINRPFNLNRSSSPTDFLQSTYYNGELRGTIQSTYYNHQDSALIGSALVVLQGYPAGSSTANDDTAFIAVNGIAQTVQTGSSFIGKWSFLTLIQSYLNGGLYSGTHRIAQLPRISITQPDDLTDLNNPGTITIAWNRQWLRWDGLKYSALYAGDFAETTGLSFAVLYSADHGATWRHIQDGSLATPGLRPADNALLYSDPTASVDWPVPAGTFGQGTYLVRVEAFRDGYPLHYSYHQASLFLKR